MKGRVTAMAVGAVLGFGAVTGPSVVAYWLANAKSEVRSDQKLLELLNQCERANRGRAVVLLNTRKVQGAPGYRRARRVAPILDCQRTVYDADGAGVPLPAADQADYLTAVANGHLPRSEPLR